MEYVAFFFMAGEDETTVTLPDSSTVVLNMGEGSFVRVNLGDTLSSDKKIQVDLITGDLMSYYELRWYSLLDTDQWKNEYLSPVGDDVGKTRMILFNPNSEALTIEIEYLVLGAGNFTKKKTLGPGHPGFSPIIPTGSGAWLKADAPFIALSLTDSSYKAGTGQVTEGQWYDWGFPVVPVEDLTPQVLIGWGFGCTDNFCDGQVDRSVVWVTPVEE